MNTLFKYSSYIESFLERPTIKLSNIKSLNDPFESEISEKVIERLANTLNHHGQNAAKILEETKVDLRALKTLLSFNGLVSFSETPRNLLMWAHYGNQHKGMCVGFSRDVLTTLTDKRKFNSSNFGVYRPIKVNCDSDRIDPKKIVSKGNVIKEILISYLTTKSDEWIYEKEHRSLISIHHAHEIIVPKDLTAYLIGQEEGGLTSEDVISILSDEGKIKKLQENRYKIYRNKISATECSFLCDIPDSSMLVNINPKYIESIYLGCRVTKDKIKFVHDSTRSSKSMSHINIYHYSLNEKRFALIPNEVTKSYIEKI